MHSLTIFSLTAIFLAVSCNAYAIDNRIVGGQEARLGQFPHQIYLKKHGSFNCGGSIYNERYIITAAHCVVQSGNKPAPPGSFTVVAGTVKLHKDGVEKSVKRVIVHEKYGNYKNDIALLELNSTLEFNDDIKPIELYDGELSSDKDVIISGFGRIYAGGPISQNLKYNTLSLLIQPKCGQKIGMYYDGIICIDHKANNGACNGDSGGPAVADGKLIGVANFVRGTCGTRLPDGYASVPFFVNWIKENTA